ncbi:MAG: inorganic diphosphatase [Microgenomates group bacterium]
MEIKVFIEVSAGGNVKYELDEKTKELKVDRFLHSAIVFPFNYGSIEGTMGQDDDPLDALVLSGESVEPGVIMMCHPIGLLEMKDEAGIDTKIIAVPDEKVDPIFGKYKNIEDVPEPTLKEIKHFFRNYKSLEPGKWVKVGSFKNGTLAQKIIKKASVT